MENYTENFYGDMRMRIPQRVIAFFHEEGSARSLAAFRILHCLGLLYFAQPLGRHAGREEFLDPPFGSGWFMELLPLESGPLAVVYVLFLLSVTAGLLGIRPTISLTIATVCGLYVFGIPQCFSKLNHGAHHLIWFTALLAASPCADAWSVDAWRKTAHSSSGAGIQYRLPLQFAWVLLSLVYLFPGLYKFVFQGWRWFLSDNILWTIYQRWYEMGDFTPLFALDAYPVFYRTAAFLVLVFEIGFVVLLFFPRWRWILAPAGIAFHASMGIFLNLQFYRIMWAFICLIDWPSMLCRKSKNLPEAVSASSQLPRTTVYVGTVLVAANVIAGLGQIDSWPFTGFPAFAVPRSPTIAGLELWKRDIDGTMTLLPRRDFGRMYVGVTGLKHKQFAVVQVLDPTGRSSVCKSLRKRILQRFPDRSADRILVYQVIRSIAPADRDQPPLQQAQYCEWNAEGVVHAYSDALDVSGSIPFYKSVEYSSSTATKRLGILLGQIRDQWVP